MDNTKELNADRKKEEMDNLVQKLNDGIIDLFESDKYAEYLKVMSKFTHYSINNTILIAMQTNGNATKVAGYEAWKNNFGRHVNRGEKAIKIFAPVTYKKKKEIDVIDQNTGKPALNPDGTVKKQIEEITLPGYKITNVFDISQTSGPPLPSIVEDLTGNVKRYQDFIKAIRAVSPVPITFEPMNGKDGYYHQIEKRIAIDDSLSEPQTMAALIHELSHAKLHALNPKNLLAVAKERDKSPETMEVEAESISFVVNSYFGIDTSANSFGYVASWSKNKELPELTASLKTIKNTAAEIIDGITEELEEMRFAYISKSESLEAIRQGEIIYKSVAKGVFKEASEEDIKAVSENNWLRMPKEQWKNYMLLRDEMNLHIGVSTIQETKLLYAHENQFGIYQIDPQTKGKEYVYLSHDFMKEQGITIDHADYRLAYAGSLEENDTPEKIMERFNSERPEKFDGHQLAVSDVILTNKDGVITPYIIDENGFDQVPEFLTNFYEKSKEIKEAAFQIENRILEIHETDGGYDYTIYNEHYKPLDGGVYESNIDLMTAAKDIVQDLKEPAFQTDYDAENSAKGNINSSSRLYRVDYATLEGKLYQYQEKLPVQKESHSEQPVSAEPEKKEKKNSIREKLKDYKEKIAKPTKTKKKEISQKGAELE